MITDALKSAFQDLWSSALYYLRLEFLDPFWGWFAYGIIAILGLLFLAWLFGDWIKPLKPIIGGLIFAILAGLAGLWKGENMARAHDAAKAKPAPKPKSPALKKGTWMPWSIIIFIMLLAMGRGAAACPSYDMLQAKLQEDGTKVEMVILMNGKAALYVLPDGSGAIAVGKTCRVMPLNEEQVQAIKARVKELDGQES